MSDVDCVVIGSGPNGLAAANSAARAGWSTLVLEAADTAGGAVRSESLTRPGFVHDTFSAFYPLAFLSPVFRRFDLAAHGLTWRWADLQNAHPAPDGETAAIGTDVDETALVLDKLSGNDGNAWRRYLDLFDRIQDSLVDVLFRPLVSPLAAARLGLHARAFGLADLARLALLSVRRLGEEWFAGEPTRRMLAGLALHSDMPPEAAGSGMYACMLAWTAQVYGFAVPQGGAGALTDALVHALHAAGGELRTSSPVVDADVRKSTLHAVRTADGDEIGVRHAVFAAVPPPFVFDELVGLDNLDPRLRDRLRRFEWGAGTFKVDWALDGHVPWDAEPARRAATVHLGDSVDDLSRYSNEFARGLIPDHPYVLVGQQCLADPSRAPDGHSTLWGYTHVPTRPRADAAGTLAPEWTETADGFADRIETRIEAVAPGFRDRIIDRHVMTPTDLERRNANLVGGDIAGGSFALWQQLVFRPVPGMFRHRTPIKRLYLASASTHPGGGVHGGAGANAFAVARRDRHLRRI